MADLWHYRVIILTLMAMFGVGWALASALLVEERRAILHWSATALIFAASMFVLQAASRPDAGPLAVHGVLIVSLVAYALAARGVDVFVHGEPKHDRFLLVTVTVTSLALLTMAHDAPYAVPRMLVYSAGKAVVLIGLPLLVARTLSHAMGRLGTAIGLLPVALYGVLGLGQALQAATGEWPSGAHIHASVLDSTEKVVSAMVAAALFNIAFLFLLVSRLVTQLRHHAMHDTLTGVLNRRAMDRLLERMWRRHLHAPNWTFTVVLVDVDHFKRVNDRHGHPVGDRVLCKVAEVLQIGLRPSDMVARFGGEEFLLLLPGLDPVHAAAVAERVRKLVATASVDLDGVPLRVTVSAGIAHPRRSDRGPSDVLSRADAALYFAKGAGRNRVADESALLQCAA